VVAERALADADDVGQRAQTVPPDRRQAAANGRIEHASAGIGPLLLVASRSSIQGD
jgi:hypothetical protein